MMMYESTKSISHLYTNKHPYSADANARLGTHDVNMANPM